MRAINPLSRALGYADSLLSETLLQQFSSDDALDLVTKERGRFVSLLFFAMYINEKYVNEEYVNKLYKEFLR